MISRMDITDNLNLAIIPQAHYRLFNQLTNQTGIRIRLNVFTIVKYPHGLYYCTSRHLEDTHTLVLSLLFCYCNLLSRDFLLSL